MRWVVLLLLLLTACGSITVLDEPRVCCEALTASCLACSEGVSVEEYCLDHPEEETCPEPEITSILYTELFDYDALEAFTYLFEIGGNELLITTEVSQEMSHGEPVLMLRATVSGSDSIIVMYVDPSTHGCKSLHFETPAGNVEDICPVEGLNSKYVDGLTLSKTGEEQIYVHGEYDAVLFSGDGVTYWVSDDVPVPVQYSGEGYVMKLVSYE